uniref:EOG090X0NBB n=1 Tax=Megafenestra aurita TaxID=2291010 RepID=A0A4Y7NHX6_9CRUS|nr:EOG090X0NBB [Megafenestra aurita]SVE92818.1 EOG090X0NBB [Megafenestra aurita]
MAGGAGPKDKAQENNMQKIDLTTLTLQQLAQLKQQLEQDLSLYQDSLQTLKIAQTKFQESADSAEKLETTQDGAPILVPLTGSMYVPGKISKPELPLIDIGTGYYAENTIEQAKSYFKRKVKFVTEQMEKVQMLGIEKSQVRDAVAEVMDLKVQAQVAANPQQAPVRT